MRNKLVDRAVEQLEKAKKVLEENGQARTKETRKSK